MMPRIYKRSRQKGAPQPPPGTVYVGRPSRYGNPYSAGTWGLDRSLQMYREDLEIMLSDRPDFLEPLRGKNLSCWCHGPEQDYGCHADILIEYANRPAGVA